MTEQHLILSNFLVNRGWLNSLEASGIEPVTSIRKPFNLITVDVRSSKKLAQTYQYIILWIHLDGSYVFCDKILKYVPKIVYAKIWHCSFKKTLHHEYQHRFWQLIQSGNQTKQWSTINSNALTLVLPNLVRRIERTRPTGPAPTTKTGSTASLSLKSSDLKKPLLWMCWSGLTLFLVLALNRQSCLLRNLNNPIANK